MAVDKDTDHDWDALSLTHPRLRNLDQERSLAFYDAAVTGTGPSRVAKWLTTAANLDAWLRRTNRQPRTRGSQPEERALAYWIARQRQNRHTLCGYQLARLKVLGVELNPRGAARNRLAADVASFREREGRLPSRKSARADERRLGEWLRRQRRQRTSK